nr:SH3 domain-binding protein 1-like [Aegilops tauschii subsp. strangulata]
MEREGGDVFMPDVAVPPPPPSRGARDKQPAAPPAPPAGNEVVTGPTLEAHTPTRRRLTKATSAPRPLEASAASSSIPDAEATSAAPADWVRGGRTGALNQAVLDVQAKLRAEADALKQCKKAFLDSRAAIRDYRNLRAATFNSNVRELDQRTADLSESQKANAILQQQLGEANTVLRTKEAECSKLAEERDRLAMQLAVQVELLQKAQKEAEVKDSNLLAEFETECSAWPDKEALLTTGFGRIEDMVNDFFPGHSGASNQAIEAYHEERRAEGPRNPRLSLRAPDTSARHRTNRAAAPSQSPPATWRPAARTPAARRARVWPPRPASPASRVARSPAARLLRLLPRLRPHPPDPEPAGDLAAPPGRTPPPPPGALAGPRAPRLLEPHAGGASSPSPPPSSPAPVSSSSSGHRRTAPDPDREG